MREDRRQEMLKEIRVDEIPASRRTGFRKTEGGKFAVEAVREFHESGMSAAEVAGWPDGDPTNSAGVNRCRTKLKYAARTLGVDVSVVGRGTRLFLVRGK